ncbi:MAG: sugar transferase [Fimbriimonadaceae bacterium]|nr:sugar transferase [Chitinophagales bacterium]
MAAPSKYDYRYVLRKSILIGVDTILILVALFLYLRFFHHTALSSNYSVYDNIIWIVLIVVLWYIYAYAFNLYRLSNVNKTAEIIKNTVITAVLTGVSYLFIPFLSPTFPLHRLPAFVLIFNMVALLIIWRLVYAKFFQHPILIKKAVIVGAGWIGREIAKTLVHNERVYHNTGYKIFGFIDDDEKKLRKVYDDLTVLAKGDMLLKYAIRLKLDEIIIAIPEQESLNSVLYANIIECENAGIHTMYATDVYETQTGRVMVKQKEKDYYLANPYNIIHSNRLYQIVNRFVNIIFALLACVFFIVILPFVFIGNLFFSRGPLFYVQERVGKNGKKFIILKFRTMIVDAEKHSGPQFATTNDKRITKPGKILRRTRLDELPQCLNILKGEMNLMGPRPEREIFINELLQVIPFFRIRNIIKPGLTGWAQVNYKYASVPDDALIKLQYDLYYIKHRSFFLDLRILLRTIGVVLKFKGI